MPTNNPTPSPETPAPCPWIDIVFDGPPGPEAGRFIEVEDHAGHSISIGEWLQRTDGYWVLRIGALAPAALRKLARGLPDEYLRHYLAGSDPASALMIEVLEAEKKSRGSAVHLPATEQRDAALAALRELVEAVDFLLRPVNREDASRIMELDAGLRRAHAAARRVLGEKPEEKP